MEILLIRIKIFYFGTLSMLTPPVCLAAYTAGSIAKAPQMPLAFRAMRLAIAGYIVPFVFLYSPGLAFIGFWEEIVLTFFAAVIAIALFAFAIEGYFLSILGWFGRALCVGTAIAIIIPSWTSRLLGVVLLASLLAIHFRKRLGRRAHQPST